MNKRQADILDLLQTEREATVTALADRFGVTPMTIRRDLGRLERTGRLRRNHGSATLSKAGVIEFTFHEKGRKHAAEKEAIARQIAKLVRPGAVVCLDTGTTTLEVARQIAGIENVTVLTTSLAIASVLHPYENLNVILLGGTVRRNSPDLTGPLTEQNLKTFRVNLSVIGADAATQDGVFTTDMNVARVTQAMMAAAESKVLAVDSSKFGATALYRFAGWDDFDQVVTDERLSDEQRRWLEKAAQSVVYASQVPSP